MRRWASVKKNLPQDDNPSHPADSCCFGAYAFLNKKLAGAEGFENEPLMLQHSPKSLNSSVPYDLGRPKS